TTFDIIHNTQFESHAVTIYGFLVFHFSHSFKLMDVSTFLGRDNPPNINTVSIRNQYGFHPY
ncbi:MAG: hypothetical protein LHW45_03365, partial [Candidatus Cloacimonetes bacterium]|nr:hypothetical protein [Candidatus Cloacimonadota bacterium]MDY0366654.1 hypothetical protein [Candidatus Syntrophosphaera sp.]